MRPGSARVPDVENLLEQARPVGQLGDKAGVLLPELTVPDEHASHADADQDAGRLVGDSAAAIAGIAGATIVYLWELISAATIRR